jgi:hypothetical protein
VSAGCGNCHLRTETSIGNIGSDFNLTHPDPLEGPPLTAKQINDLIAYIIAG